MKRTVLIRARTTRPREELPAHIATRLDKWRRSPLGDEFRAMWTFEEPDWGTLDEVRSYLAGGAFSQVVESYVAAFDDSERRAATIVQLHTSEMGGVESGGSPIHTSTCESCGRRVRRFVEDQALELSCKASGMPGLVTTSESGVMVASAAFLRALADAGLDGGLRTFPVHVPGAREGTFQGLYAPTTLGWPAAPYGSVPGGCESCGWQPPRFNFYRCFERPAHVHDWMSWPLHGPASPVVSGRVYRWLLDEGTDLVGGDDRARRLIAWPYGWYPDDAEQAFLPEAFHGDAQRLLVPAPGEGRDRTTLDGAVAAARGDVTAASGVEHEDRGDAPRDRNGPTERLLALWKERLQPEVERRRPAAERLLALAQASEDWTSAIQGDRHYLIHTRRSLHVLVSEDDPFPYRGLSCSPVVGAAGGIATDVGLGKLSKRVAADFFPEVRRRRSFPRPFFALQTTPHGAPVGYNNHGVFMLDKSMTFRKIGPFEAFVGYCVHQVVDGREWFTAFRDKRDLEEHGLEWIAPWVD